MSGAQANKFYEEVLNNRILWFAENSQGVALEFGLKDGKMSFPFLSSESRVIRIIKLKPKLLAGFKSREISWDPFKEVMVPILDTKERVVGC